MDQLLEKLVSATKTSHRKFDLHLLEEAYEFTKLAHTGQLRKSGEPYLIHPVETALLLVEWGMDQTTVVAGLLHDTAEDGGATYEDLEKLFGTDIAILVDGVTKISNVKLKGSQEDEFVENLRKMILVMAKDLRVVFVKLADRLHNMRTIEHLQPGKQIKFATETLQVYGPLADRLGMGEVYGELSDLAFKYSMPEEYAKLIEQTKDIYSETENRAKKLRDELIVAITPQIPNVDVKARRKHVYSLYRKLQRPEINFDLDKVHDLVAARIITDTIAQCYVALGIVHSLYKPVPYLGVSDYIANPKPNGYQSLHTKVFGPDGYILEIQIRTEEMHEQAEMGLAAHFNYAEAKSKGVSDEKLEKGAILAPQEKLNWVKQLLTWQQQISDNQEYFATLKFDALAHRILVFSPIGDVFDLPYGSTPIDFAYRVHTQLGNQASGAKINGKMVPLDYKLGNGDVVEIVVDRKKNKPNRDWLRFAATHVARSHIAKALKS